MLFRSKRSVATPFDFCGLPSRAGNRYDSLATPLGTWRVRPVFCHMLSSFVIHMLNLSVVFICVVIMHHSVICLWHFILLCLNNYGVIYCFAYE